MPDSNPSDIRIYQFNIRNKSTNDNFPIMGVFWDGV